MKIWTLACTLLKELIKHAMADQKEFQRNGRKAFLLLYKHLVRSHLEYCNSVWAPYKKSYIDKLEKVHKRATKMTSEF